MYKSCVIGEENEIFGFKMIGVEIFPITSVTEGVDLLKTIIEDDYKIIYITDKYYNVIIEKINYNSNSLYTIIVIPGINSNKNLGINKLKKCVKQALGSDIIFK